MIYMREYDGEFSYAQQVQEAVADAMLYAQGEQITNDYAIWRLRTKLPAHQILTKVTKSACAQASQLAASFLLSRHRELFTSVVLLRTTSLGELVNRWGMHQVFLAEDITGRFYSGSPANFSRKDRVNRLTTVLQTDSLEAMLVAIAKQDGGTWPTKEDIKKAFADHPDNILPRFLVRNSAKCLLIGVIKEKGIATPFTDTKILYPVPKNTYL